MSIHLCGGSHVPEYMQSAFIGAGYRVDYHWRACLKSVFRLHNETWNVWTHLIGFLIFTMLTIEAAYYAGHHEHIFDFANQFHSQSFKGILADVQAHNFTDSLNAWEFEHFAQTKIEEMRGYAADVQHQIQHQMDTVHVQMDNYIKEFEKSVHDLQNLHPYFPVSHFKSKMMDMQDQFTNKLNTYAPQSKLPLIVFLLSAMACFLGSALFHTFGCQSKSAFYFFLKVDYSGISLLIAGSIVPFVCYTFHALKQWQYFYLISLLVVCAAVIYVSFAERFSANEYQPYRAGLFVLMASFFLMPLIHMFLVFDNVDMSAIRRFLCSALLYILGVLSYVFRLPERFSPGKFDIWLHSHQVFHMFILVAAIVWYTFALRLWEIHTHTFVPASL